MANPKRRFSHSKAYKRKAKWFTLKVGGFSLCPQCHTPKIPHRVCPSCGYYKGNLVLQTTKKT